MERHTDVETGETEEVFGGKSHALEDTGEYYKKSQKSTKSDVTVFLNEDDPKDIEKEVLGNEERSDTLPVFQIDVSRSDAINFVRVTSSDVSTDALQLANSSIIEVFDQSDLNREDGNSEIVERCLGEEMKSTVGSSTDAAISTTRYSVAECLLASKLAHEAAEKEVLGNEERSDTLPGFQVGVSKSDAINFVRVASSDVNTDAFQLTNASIIEVSDRNDLNREDGNSEIVERCLGEEMKSTVGSSTDAAISTTRYSVAECLLASRVAHGAADKAYKAESSCHKLMKVIDETIVVIRKQVDEILIRALAQLDTGETTIDFSLADKMCVSLKVLTSRGKELRTVAKSAAVAAIHAYQNGDIASDVTEEEPLQSRQAKFNNAYSSKNAADLESIVACKTALVALTIMEEVLIDL